MSRPTNCITKPIDLRKEDQVSKFVRFTSTDGQVYEIELYPKGLYEVYDLLNPNRRIIGEDGRPALYLDLGISSRVGDNDAGTN